MRMIAQAPFYFSYFVASLALLLSPHHANKNILHHSILFLIFSFFYHGNIFFCCLWMKIFKMLKWFSCKEQKIVWEIKSRSEKTSWQWNHLEKRCVLESFFLGWCFHFDYLFKFNMNICRIHCNMMKLCLMLSTHALSMATEMLTGFTLALVTRLVIHLTTLYTIIKISKSFSFSFVAIPTLISPTISSFFHKAIKIGLETFVSATRPWYGILHASLLIISSKSKYIKPCTVIFTRHFTNILSNPFLSFLLLQLCCNVSPLNFALSLPF